MKRQLLILFGLMLFDLSFSQEFAHLIDKKLILRADELKVGDNIPNWGIIPLDNKKWVSLKEFYKEEMVLIEFWFTQCPFCIKSIPNLNELHSKYHGNGLKIVYANALFNEGESDIIKFKKVYNIQFDVYKFGNIFLGSMPTFILIDKNGIIRYKADGYPDDLIADIERLIK